MEYNENIFTDIKNVNTKKSIMAKYDISSDEYKKYYSEFLNRKKEAKHNKQRAMEHSKDIIIELDYQAKNEILDLKDVYGVYLLYKQDKIIYVGVSVNLGERILASMTDKASSDSFSYIDTDSMADAYILEVLLINKIKPVYNNQSKGDGVVSFDIPVKYEYENLHKFYKKL